MAEIRSCLSTSLCRIPFHSWFSRLSWVLNCGQPFIFYMLFRNALTQRFVVLSIKARRFIRDNVCADFEAWHSALWCCKITAFCWFICSAPFYSGIIQIISCGNWFGRKPGFKTTSLNRLARQGSPKTFALANDFFNCQNFFQPQSK